VSLPHYELGAAGVRLLLGLDQAPAGSALKIACPAVERASVAVHSPA
jgi:LacI family transcriptional regulator